MDSITIPLQGKTEPIQTLIKRWRKHSADYTAQVVELRAAYPSPSTEEEVRGPWRHAMGMAEAYKVAAMELEEAMKGKQ